MQLFLNFASHPINDAFSLLIESWRFLSYQLDSFMLTRNYSETMNTNTLEKSLQKLLIIKSHISLFESDPLLLEEFHHELQQLKITYGSFLNEILFTIYDEYCEDDPCPDILEFLLAPSNEVHPEDVPGEHAFLVIKTQPLRIEMQSSEQSTIEVMWQAA